MKLILTLCTAALISLISVDLVGQSKPATIKKKPTVGKESTTQVPVAKDSSNLKPAPPPPEPAKPIVQAPPPAAPMPTVPATNKLIKGSVLLGYGFKDGFNLGFGVRGQYALQNNFDVGGIFIYHLGKSESREGVSFGVNILFIGAEGGYNFPVPNEALKNFIIRPYAGLGVGRSSVDVPEFNFNTGTFGKTSKSDTDILFTLGGLATTDIGENLFIGADAKLYLKDGSAFALFLTAGMHF